MAQPSSDAEATLKGRTTAFRDYAAEARPSVKTFYQLNHRHQTFDFVRQKEAEYLSLNRKAMGAWETLEFLNTLVDDSDPDLDLTQLDHALQTAESIRRANQPRWMIATGLIHDLGKVLCFWGEPQWAVVGDTFPVGCAFSDSIVYPGVLRGESRPARPAVLERVRHLQRHCGLEKVHMSWGHDEYLYHAVKDRLPVEAHYMLRYHSFYAAHREGAYGHLMNDRDREMFKWVRRSTGTICIRRGREARRRAA